MADTRVPRFYIDAPTLYNALGKIKNQDNSLNVNYFDYVKGGEFPLPFIDEDGDPTSRFNTIEYNSIYPISSLNYMGVLGHNFNKTRTAFNIATVIQNPFTGGEISAFEYNVSEDIESLSDTSLKYYNCGEVVIDGKKCFMPDANGSSFVLTKDETYDTMNVPFGFFNHQQLTMEFGGEPFETRRIFWNLYQDYPSEINSNIGSLTYGWTYTMPFAADVNLNLDIEYDGYDEIESLGGNTLTNIRYTGIPKLSREPYNLWNNREYDGVDFGLSGRRIWKLKFSYLKTADNNNALFTNLLTTGADKWFGERGGVFHDATAFGDQDGYQTLGLKCNFFTRVIHGTLGGALPFVFQPDKEVEDFAICKLDQDSFQFKKIAPELWEISLKIKEVW